MKYKVTRVYIVYANTKTEALDAIHKAIKDGVDGEHLSWESVKDAETPKTGGWLNTVKTQVTGK